MPTSWFHTVPPVSDFDLHSWHSRWSLCPTILVSFGPSWASGSYGQIRPDRVTQWPSGVCPREVKLRRTGTANPDTRCSGSMASKKHCDQNNSTQFGWFGTLVAQEHQFAGGRTHPFWPILAVLVTPSPGAPRLRGRVSEKIANSLVRAPQTVQTFLQGLMPPNIIAHIMVPHSSTGFRLRFAFLAFSVVPVPDHFGDLFAFLGFWLIRPDTARPGYTMAIGCVSAGSQTPPDGHRQP